MNRKKDLIKSRIMLIILLLTFALPYLLLSFITIPNAYDNRFYYIYYLNCIFPLMAIVLGKKYKYIFNTALGIILLVAYVGVGISSQGYFMSIYKYKVNNYIVTDIISKDIDFNLPKKGSVMKLNDHLNNKNKNIVFPFKNISFENALILDRKDARQFVNTIKKSDKWVSKLDKTNKSLVEGIVNKKNNKNIYHLIYIKETNSFNKMPYEKGEYNVYYLRYEVKSRMLRIYKYCYYVN